MTRRSLFASLAAAFVGTKIVAQTPKFVAAPTFFSDYYWPPILDSIRGEVGPDGPQGPCGMPGPAGPDANGRCETQEQHEARWQAAIEHNKRYFESHPDDQRDYWSKDL